MSWKHNSIIWFDDPQLIDSLWTENRKEIEEIFELFKKTDFKQSLLFNKNTDEWEYNFVFTEQRWTVINIEQENYSIFEKEYNLDLTWSIIANHKWLIKTTNDDERTKRIDDIIKEILIMADNFSNAYNIDFYSVWLSYIKYIVNNTIQKLRLDYRIFDDNIKENDLINTISKSLKEKEWEMNQMIYYINNSDNSDIDWGENVWDKYEIDDQQKKDLIEYYMISCKEYALLMKKEIISWKKRLWDLYNRLYDLILIHSALRVLQSKEGDYQDEE